MQRAEVKFQELQDVAILLIPPSQERLDAELPQFQARAPMQLEHMIRISKGCLKALTEGALANLHCHCSRP